MEWKHVHALPELLCHMIFQGFKDVMGPSPDLGALSSILCDCHEYAVLDMRLCIFVLRDAN